MECSITQMSNNRQSAAAENPRYTQMLVTVSFPALYSGLINQFLRIFKPALPDFYPFFFTWKNYAKVQKILDICKFLGNFFSNRNDI